MNSELKIFIKTRLENIQKRPSMYGSPDAIETQGFVYIELLNNFCLDSPIDMMKEYQALCKIKFPKRPGPLPLHHWLTDKEYGLGLDSEAASQKIADLFINLFNKLYKEEINV